MTTFSSSLSEPSGSQALVGAVTWLQSTILGTVATSVAVIGIAFLGLRMLSGRIDIKRGTTAIVGCFIIFGAPRIAAGLQRAALDTSPVRIAYAVSPPELALPIGPTPVPTPVADPYAGASLPQ